MWLADDARLLHVASLAADEVIPNQMRGALTRTPVPGDAALVLVDAWALVATLSNRAAWRLDWRGWRPRWIQVAKEDPMHPIVKAHASCDGIWTVDPERRVSVQGRPAIGSSPVPGSEPIATFDIASGIVLLDNGARFGWLGGRWTALPSLTDAATTMLVRGTGFGVATSVGALHAGETLELPTSEALEYVRQGRAEPVVDPQ